MPIHRGDVGTVIVLTVTEGGSIADLSPATVKKIRFRKPNNSVVEKTGDFTTDGSDGKLQYTTVLGDLDLAGEWLVQAYLEFPSGKVEHDSTIYACS